MSSRVRSDESISQSYESSTGLFLITWLRERMRGLARWSTLPLVRLLDFKELLLNLAALKEIKHQHLARKRELDKQIRGLQEEQEKKTEEASTSASASRPRARLAKWKKEFLQELRAANWVVPEDEEVVGPGQRTDLTAGQALRTQELLEELEERKAIKNQCLEEKRGLVQEI
ncbi:hypothetical protein CNMCM6457_009190 [Aspergillus fumigatiaffinis]|nr:hypothetical protein CNMCM6457_009190 [Aspergillus fumigatiaffinis]